MAFEGDEKKGAAAVAAGGAGDAGVMGPNPATESWWGDALDQVGGLFRGGTAIGIASAVLVLYPSYKAALIAQQTASKKIPDNIVAVLRPHYDIDWGAVTYRDNINTFHGQAITLSNDIFFTRRVDFTKREDLYWLLHELEHVRQFRVRTLPDFIRLYVDQALGAGKSVDITRSINLHDAIGLEKEANDKARNIFPSVWAELRKRGVVSKKDSEAEAVADARFALSFLSPEDRKVAEDPAMVKARL